MIKKVLETFGLRSIQAVYADREFPSQKFLQFLSSLEIQFVFRIKNNTNLSGRKAEDYAKHLIKGQEIQLGKKKFLGVQAYVVLTLTEKGDLMAIASHHPIEANLYRRRWSIETMFRKFKTDGFNLESSRLKSRERLAKLFALLSIMMALIMAVSSLSKESKSTRKKSLFRRGLDFLYNAFSSGIYFSSLINFLSSIPSPARPPHTCVG